MWGLLIFIPGARTRKCLQVCSTCTNILNDFCNSVDIVPTIRNTCCHIDYTYNFNMHKFSTLDHFMVSGTLFDNALVNVTVMHDGDNLSDHDPIVIGIFIMKSYTRYKV